MLFQHTLLKTITTQPTRVFSLISVAVTTALLSACSPPLAEPSKHYYHAPARAYNLFLGNPALRGQPTLRESCSEHGSSVEIIDAAGDFFRIDTINLLSTPYLYDASDKAKSVQNIKAYYRKLYNAPFKDAPAFSVPVNQRKQLYISLPLDHPGPVADKGRVVGMLVTKVDSYLYNVQHVQKVYNREQMLQKLNAMQNALTIPGSFKRKDIKKLVDKDGKNIQLPQGFVKIDPNSATPEEITTWRRDAKCF